MSKEFVFWFYVVPKSNFVFLWDMPKDLVRVVINQHGIKSDSPMHINGNDVLDVAFSDITEISVNYGSKGGPSGINIKTRRSKSTFLVANPFDPRLLSHRNFDETKAFVAIVKALMENADPVLGENPYTRQSKTNDKPSYVNTMLDFQWDENASPWKYYFEFVPASQDKIALMVANVWKFIIWGWVLFMVYGASLATYTQVTHADKSLIARLFVPTVPIAFGLLVIGLMVVIYAKWKK